MPTNFTPGVNGVTNLGADLNTIFTQLDTAIENMVAGSKALTAPTINSFANSTHDHVDAAGGGQLEADEALLATAITASYVLSATGSGGVTWAANTASILTTKGDMLVRKNSFVDRLPIGTNTHVLIADSAQAFGLKWGSTFLHDPDYDSGWFAVVYNTLYTKAHGLALVPRKVIILHAAVAAPGGSDELVHVSYAAAIGTWGMGQDNTNVYVKTGSDAAGGVISSARRTSATGYYKIMVWK